MLFILLFLAQFKSLEVRFMGGACFSFGVSHLGLKHHDIPGETAMGGRVWFAALKELST
jgi:hypothetical protein